MLDYIHASKVFTKSGQEIKAVDNINLTINQGEFVVFLGPSGCGKSTTLKLTNRLEGLTSGQIKYHDKDIKSFNPIDLRQSMGYVIQNIGLFPNKNIEDNITMLLKILGWKKEARIERAHELLELVNLTPDIYAKAFPHQLSGGQQQRVGVVRALAANPDTLLMDEPFGAIDPINREQIQDEFLSIQSKLKKTIIMVSHDIHEAIKMADRIVIFQNGQIVQCDTPDQILTQPANEFVADFVGADRALKVMGLIKAKDVVDQLKQNIIPSGATCDQAKIYMEAKNVSYAYVIKNAKPIGFVTPKILTPSPEERVDDKIHALPTICKSTHTLKEVMSHMLLNNCDIVPIVNNNGEYIGTLTYSDIHEHILDIYNQSE